jgi:hypothetical protein
MTNLILPSNSITSSGISPLITTALNFMGASDNARFSRTNGSNGSDTQATLSCWLKYQGRLSQSLNIFMAPDSSGDSRFYINFSSSETVTGTHRYPDRDFSSTYTDRHIDCANWYHVVARINTSESTAGDRIKIYVNNRQIDLTVASGGLGSGNNIGFNKSGFKNIFGYNDVSNDGVSNLADCYFAEVIKCDGQLYLPTDFAEYDSTSGQWIPKDDLESSLTFGTTGYYYDFANSSDLGNDISGNNNDATISNCTQSLDTPSNSFAVMNHLDRFYGQQLTWSKGNRKIVASSSSHAWTSRYALSTFPMFAGVWYAEFKVLNEGASNQFYVGVIKDVNGLNFDSSLGYISGGNGYGYYANAGQIVNNGSDLSSGASYTANDIIGVKLDLDSNTLDFYKNGSHQGSQVTGLSGTMWHFAVNGYQNFEVECNFGNPPYTISSANQDPNEFGSFEYDTQSGYACCTANLATEG